MRDASIHDILEVKNFGPIVEAKIDLRPLTVFIGPSNTGKSWLAILIYALHRHFSSTQKNMMFWRSRKPDPSTIENLADWAQKIIIDNENFTNEKIFYPDFLMTEIYNIFKNQKKQLENDILRCFGMNQKNALIRKASRNGAFVKFQRNSTNNITQFVHETMIKSKLSSIEISMPSEKIKININAMKYFHSMINNIISPGIISLYDQKYHLYRQFMEIFLDTAIHQIVGPMYSQAFYLPADRTGIMHAHSTVVSAIIGNASMAAIEPTIGTSRLSGVLSDFLRALIELDKPIPRSISSIGRPRSYRFGQRKSWKHNLDKQIEKSILGGSVRMKPSDIIGYPHFTYRPQDWKNDIPLIHASSMVSELAPVVLYLRHLIQPNDTLIIEEPEAHLHPAMQSEFTRHIASFVHAGIRVIVTTHSEWVLETLANLVRLADIPETQRKEITGDDLALHPEQVGAWLFKQKRSPKGSVVEEIKFDAEAGGLASDYGKVAEELYNEWATIGNKITETTE